MNWSLVGKRAAGTFTGLNWWMLAAKALIIVALFAGGYMMGKNKAQVACEVAKTELAEAKAKAVTRFVEVQVPIVTEREVKSTEIKYVTRSTGEKLNEAINKKRTNSGCDLSDDEFVRWNELAKATRTR